MTNEELYQKECDCPEIQKGWKPKVGDAAYNENREEMIWFQGGKYIDGDYRQYGFIFLPSLSQLIAMLGKRFLELRHNEKEWSCLYYLPKTKGAVYVYGTTPELACIRAYKEIIKEEK